MSDPSASVRPHLARRSDIQALRALAIALVVAAHARVPGIRGGFVGVDAFFVLSGYLISGLILVEIDATGEFRAWAFYARRLKRLLPALFLVLAATAAVGWVVASPGQQKDAAAGSAASLWVSNLYFAAQVIDYFSEGFRSNLFLHTWSLGVEEQFYLIWPWLLLTLCGIWNWHSDRRSRKWLAIGLVLVGFASLALGVYWSETDTEAGFYLMPGRTWEFALGALTFLLRERVDTGYHGWLASLRAQYPLNIYGWFLILLASFTYSGDLRYPGCWALLPCMGAALVLLDAPERRRTGPASRVIAGQPALLGLGAISYSLYLWHWPILILAEQTFGVGAMVRLMAVVLSVALAAVTYIAVESPVRRMSARKPLGVFLPSGVAIGMVLIGMNAWNASAAARQDSPVQAHIAAARLDAPAIYVRQGCDTWYHSAQVVPCEVGPRDAAHVVAMFGDSILAQWYPAVVDVFLHRPDWKVVVLTKSACSASQVSYFYGPIKATYEVCNVWRKLAIRYLVRMHPDIVIMGSARYRFTAKQWISGTRAVLARLSPAVKHVIVMSPTPELRFNGPDCLSEVVGRPRWLPSPGTCGGPLKPARRDIVYRSLKQAILPFDNVSLVDLRSSVCPDKSCRAEIGSEIVYRDSGHLTATFVESLVPPLRAAFAADGVLR